MVEPSDAANDRGEPTPHDAAKPKKPRTPDGTLRTALFVYAVLNGGAGLAIFLFPGIFWDTIGGAGDVYEVAYGSTRFGGGALLALAFGALVVLRKPAGQHTLVTVLAVEATLVAVAVIGNVFVDDVPTSLWFELVIALGSAAIAVYLWWARLIARTILKAE